MSNRSSNDRYHEGLPSPEAIVRGASVSHCHDLRGWLSVETIWLSLGVSASKLSTSWHMSTHRAIACINMYDVNAIKVKDNSEQPPTS